MQLFRIETTVGEPNDTARTKSFVDWYWGETEAKALETWNEDCHRYGLTMEKVSKSVRKATESELAACNNAPQPN